MNPRRAAVLIATIAGVVAVVSAALDAANVALAAVAVAVLGVLGYLVVSLRSLAEAVAAVNRSDHARREAKVVAGARRGGRRRQSTPTADVAVASRSQGVRPKDVRRHLREVAKGQVDIRNAIDRAPGLTAEMLRVYEHLVPHSHPMPELGGWAATPSTILWMLDHVMSSPVRTVVECGSGTSTIWLATALARRGGEGHVVALESSDLYAERTRAELERLGLGERATVLHAPLVDTVLPDRSSQAWYDVAGLNLREPIDLLFVDGPPSRVAPQARYPALPVLAEMLAPDAVVVLDDTGRAAEDAIVARWSREVHAGRVLEVSRTVDRSTVLVVRKV